MLQDMAPNALGPTSLAAERLVWAGIDRAFAALPSGERAAKAIGALLVIEQDLDWVRRAPAAAGLDPLAATRATIRLRHIVRARHLERLAASTQDAGPLANALPEAWTWARHVTDWDELTFAARRRRRVLCERAFVGDPFVLAVPIAVVLFKEEELRALSAAREAGETRTPALDRAQAGSLVGVA
jgi:hypothetical protein